MIKVLKSGFYTSIQDLGRFGYGNIGVPVSGAMDQFSSKLANKILNDDLTNAILEITQGNCSLLFQKTTSICITGADCTATIAEKKITLNTAITIHKDEILSFGKPKYGVRTYLAVNGGFLTETVLGSKSYFKGISTAVRIKKGDLLPTRLNTTLNSKTNASLKINYNHFNTIQIRAYKGPEYNLLSKTQQKLLEQTIFTISNDNNRMGYRLEEAIINNLESILTSAVLPGTVQLTPSGKLIVLLRDCQVTGGYPRILQLTENAINQLAQKTTGDVFNFKLKF